MHECACMCVYVSVGGGIPLCAVAVGWGGVPRVTLATCLPLSSVLVLYRVSSEPELGLQQASPSGPLLSCPPPYSSRVAATCTGAHLASYRALDLNSSSCAVEMQVLLPTEPSLQSPRHFF